MEIFAVTLASPTEDKMSCLTRCLSDAFADLHKHMLEPGLWEADAAAGRLAYRTEGRALPPKERTAVLRRGAAGLAEYVLTAVEPELLRVIVRKQYQYDQDEELERIVWHCRQLLYGSGAPEEAQQAWESRSRRKRKIEEELLGFLQEQPAVHLDGYITFRLDFYWEELAEVAEYAVDEFVMDKQYQEFISLLNYFVCLQEPKIPLIHLVQTKDGEFGLFDERFEPIEHRTADKIVADMLEAEMNVEDLVVSTLIGISPGQVILHTQNPDLPVVRTIEAIFEHRVTVCTNCWSCRSIIGGAAKPLDYRSP